MSTHVAAGMALTDSRGVDPHTLRRVCGSFATGVVVVTSGTAAPVSGLTVNSFTSVSLDPPLILVCIQHQSSQLPELRRTGAFAVNILAADQEDMGQAFSSYYERRLVQVDTHRGITGVPILSAALAYLECRVDREVQAGDHLIIIGEVLGLAVQREDKPLTFFRSNYHELAARP